MDHRTSQLDQITGEKIEINRIATGDYEKESGMPSIALNGISSQGGDRGWQTLVEGLVATAKNAIKCLCLRKSNLSCHNPN